jgi:hypothetical protein
MMRRVLIGSSVLQCVEYSWPITVRQDVIFFVFQSDSQANAVNINARPQSQIMNLQLLYDYFYKVHKIKAQKIDYCPFSACLISENFARADHLNRKPELVANDDRHSDRFVSYSSG